MAGTPAVTMPVDVTMTFGNPFPGSPLECTVQSFFTVSYALPGTTGIGVDYAMLSRNPTCFQQPATLTVVMSPPQKLMIDGADATGSAMPPSTVPPLTTDTPTLSWSPPAQGVPSRYEVDVIHLQASSGATGVKDTQYIFTPNTTLTIPPGVLTSGGNYAFVVLAADTCGDCDTYPLRFKLPSSAAPAFTGMFKAP